MVRPSASTFHRIAVTQARIDPDARPYLDRKRSQGQSTREALRCLKRHGSPHLRGRFARVQRESTLPL